MTPRIVKAPDDRLRVWSTEVTDFEEAKKITSELLFAVKSVAKFWKLWLGFAAPQIGYNKRIIVLRDGRKGWKIMLNPVVSKKRWPFFYPGRCYSLDGRYLMKGYLWRKVKSQDLQGDYHEEILRGPSALEHEIDHLNGLLASDIGKRIF